MKRKDFIKNIFLATGMYMLPKILRPEEVGFEKKDWAKRFSKGLYHELKKSDESYVQGSLSMSDFERLMRDIKQ